MPDDVFTDNQGAPTNVLETLVGDGKKFNDNEALAKGKLESDTFIEQLKEEKRLLSEALEAKSDKADKTATIADLIKEVRESQKPSDQPPTKELSEEDFQERVRTIVDGDETAKTNAANRALGNKLVLDKMKGSADAAKAYVAERAAELGTTPAKLAELSETSPKAFAKLMDVDPKSVPKGTVALPNVDTTSVDAGAQVMVIDGHQTKAWFDAQKKEMGLVPYVNDTKLQLAYMRAATALGDKFYPK